MDQWCHIGTASDESEWAESLAALQAWDFDLDSYWPLRHYLEQAEVIQVP